MCCRLDRVGVAVYLCVRGLMCSCVLSVIYKAMVYGVFIAYVRLCVLVV